MNPLDRAIAAGGWQSFMPATFPTVLGVDVAGTVEKANGRSSRFAVGDARDGKTVIVL